MLPGQDPERLTGPESSVSQLGDLDVLEADLHGRADVDLQGDDALVVKLLVGAIDDAGAVEVDRDVLALRSDHEVVPVVVLDQLLGLVCGVTLEGAAAPLFVEQPQ